MSSSSSRFGVVRPWPPPADASTDPGSTVLVAIERGRAVRGSIGGSLRHCHHAAVVLVGIEDELDVTLADGRAVRGRVVVVAPDVEISSSRRGATLAVLRDLDVARCGWVAPDPVVVLDEPAATLVELAYDTLAHGDATLARGAEIEALAFRGLVAPRAHHAAVRKILTAADQSSSLGGWSVEQMSDLARASHTHLRNLFHREIGISPRRWLRWIRVCRTFEAIAGTPPMALAPAALHAGFADQSHFTRTCVEFFGQSPSSLLLRPRADQIVASVASSATSTGVFAAIHDAGRARSEDR